MSKHLSKQRRNLGPSQLEAHLCGCAVDIFRCRRVILIYVLLLCQPTVLHMVVGCTIDLQWRRGQPNEYIDCVVKDLFEELSKSQQIP